MEYLGQEGSLKDRKISSKGSLKRRKISSQKSATGREEGRKWREEKDEIVSFEEKDEIVSFVNRTNRQSKTYTIHLGNFDTKQI